MISDTGLLAPALYSGWANAGFFQDRPICCEMKGPLFMALFPSDEIVLVSGGRSRPGKGAKNLALIATEARQVLVNLFLIAAGSAIYVVGLSGILVPHSFLNGGLLGLSLIFHYLWPSLNLGLLYLVFNIPLFVLGLFRVSRSFILYTGIGVLIFSALTELLTVPPFPVHDKILAAVLAGIICGSGAGLILRSAGSAGGLDILAVYLYKRFSFRVGLTSLISNGLILGAAAIIFGLEAALYTLIFVFTQARVMEIVLTGLNRRKMVLVISEKADEISQAVLSELHRGVTFLEGTGAYSGREKKVLLSVVTMIEMGRIKQIITTIDPHAFIIINDTLDVVGSSVGQRMRW